MYNDSLDDSRGNCNAQSNGNGNGNADNDVRDDEENKETKGLSAGRRTSRTLGAYTPPRSFRFSQFYAIYSALYLRTRPHNSFSFFF